MFDRQNLTENLFKAIEFNQPQLVLQYLQQGVDFQIENNGITFVKYAIALGHWHIIKIFADYLSENHISVQPTLFKKDPFDLNYALKCSIKAGQNACTASLKNAGVKEEIIIITPYAATEQLFYDISKGKADDIATHLIRGADLNEIRNNKTPIELAIHLSHWNIVEIFFDYLIEKNISVKPAFFDNDPFHLGYVLKKAIIEQHFNFSFKLINAGVNLETTDITSEQISEFKKQRVLGFNPMEKNLEGMSALYLAVFMNRFDLVLAILKAGACPNHPSAFYVHASGKKDVEYPLHLAIKHGYSQVAALLFNHNANYTLKIKGWDKLTSWNGSGEPYYWNLYGTLYSQSCTYGMTPEDTNKACYKQAWLLANYTSLLAEKVFLILLGESQLNSICCTVPIELWKAILTDMIRATNEKELEYSFIKFIDKKDKMKSYKEIYKINNFVSKYNFPFFGKTQESKDLVAAMDKNKYDSDEISRLKYNFFKEKFTTGTYNPESRAVKYMKEERITNDKEIQGYFQQCIEEDRKKEIENTDDDFKDYVIINNSPK